MSILVDSVGTKVTKWKRYATYDVLLKGAASGSCNNTGTSDDFEVLQQREANLNDPEHSVHSKTIRI